MAEFKISRLRFSWVGVWANDVQYKRDDIIQHDGKAYVCTFPHTSTEFYADLNYVEPGIGPEPRWDLMMTGQTFKGNWQQNTLYSLDNIVIFGGFVYICKINHTSGLVLDDDSGKWEVYAESKVWQNTWSINTVYGVGDIVKYGGTVYECTVSHISAATIVLGLEEHLENWKTLSFGVSYQSDYTPETRYKINDIVKNKAALYICTTGHVAGNIFDPDSWELWLPGIDYENTWNLNTVYQPGDVVDYGGYLYLSLTINNAGNVPTTSPVNWEVFSTSYDIQGEWGEETTTFKIGSVVRKSGNLYVAIQDSTNQNPTSLEVSTTYNSTGSSGTTVKVATTSNISVGMNIIGAGFTRGQNVVSITNNTTLVLNEAPDGSLSNGQVLTFVGVNTPYWAIIVPGTNWSGRWSTATAYVVNDIAYWKNVTYRCIRNHVSSTSPELDTSNSYWVIYVEHNKYNILNNPGEIPSHHAGQVVPVAIGDNTNVLKSVSSFPTWSEIFYTPAVYYVAENGIDDPARGTTWDIPWRTIKYACDFVAQGTMNPNAKYLLENNKEFIIAEMYQWMLTQQSQSSYPFNTPLLLDETRTKRDARYIIDAVVYDLVHGGNSQTVAATLMYFDVESTNKYATLGIATRITRFVATINRLFVLIEYVLNNTEPTVNYQELNNVISPIEQVINLSKTVEAGVLLSVSMFQGIIVTALSNGTIAEIPPSNQGLSTTIFIKSGTFEEIIPIVVPANTALVGDELRGTVVRPTNVVNTLATRIDGDINFVTVGSTVNVEHNTPVQFVSMNPITDISTIFGGVIAGQTYYAIGDTITETGFKISATPDGSPVDLVTNTGFMHVYGGLALSDMFYVQNGTGIRNMTLNGLLGTLTAENEFLTRRPTGGAYVSLDPGTGPTDTRSWIIRKSPYMQNVTNFGTGCVGLKIDSTLHEGGNRSAVCNDFTQIISDGIGIWCKGGDSLVEAVSVFCYYNYAGYFSEDGGRIRATNGNSSYGTYGVVAEGYDLAEVPGTGNVYNKADQATATAISSFGTSSEILKIQYGHAGENYTNNVTNTLLSSNNFLTNWTTDGNITILQASSAPFENTEAWRLVANTGLTDSSYIYQNITIPSMGGVYNGLSGTNLTGSGTNATFNITVTSDLYQVTVNNGGSGYVVGNQIRILGSVFGGIDGVNDLTITVESLSISSILTVNSFGVVPLASDLRYNASIYAKRGTSATTDIAVIFSGVYTRTSYVTFNFDSGIIASSSGNDNGVVPLNATATLIDNGWYRISFSVYDPTAQNTTLQFRIYPRGLAGIAGFTNFYGAQLQIGEDLGFYLETNSTTPSAFANYKITGAGTGAIIVGDELRSNSIFQARLITGTSTVGGAGYLTATNNSQGGNSEYLILAQSDVASATEYEGMRLFINSGSGAGQYGIISRFDPFTKYAYVLKESFDSMEVTESDETSDRLTVSSSADFNKLYLNQAIQFTPTYYYTTVTSVSQDQVVVTETVGGVNNRMTVNSTARLSIGMGVTFTGTVFGGVIKDYKYYIIDVIDATTIQLSTSFGGAVWPLTDSTGTMNLNYPANTGYMVASSTADMAVNYPIQFTGVSIGGVDLGTTYYINDIIDATTFTISESLVTIAAVGTSSANNSITCDLTSALTSLNPIVFTGTGFGNIVSKTKYYVNTVLDQTHFTIASSLITRTATASQTGSNLITVNSTAGFIANSPIVFTGSTFGGIVNDRVYYIQVINDGTTFTISSTPGGAALNVSSAAGEVIVRTPANTVPLSNAAGTLTGVSTSTKLLLNDESGSMEASFYTEVFGGVSAGQTYYVLAKYTGATNQITLTDTSGGVSAVQLTTATGSMQIGAVGWDNLNPGTPDVPVFDSTSVYYIEPRIKFSEPSFNQTSAILPDLPLGVEYTKLSYGNNMFIGVPESGALLPISYNSNAWTARILPVSATWSDAIYGNKFWMLLSWAGSGAGSTVLVSASEGQSWKKTYLPSVSAWSHLAYGNGTFVAMSNGRAYNNVASSTITGTGADATFNVKVVGTTYTALVNTAGTGYAFGDTIKILGTAVGGVSPANDITLTVVTVGGLGELSSVSTAGTAVSGNIAQPAYTTNYGRTWSSGSGLPNSNWVGVAFGIDRFVAIAKSSASAAYSTNGGATWSTSSLPAANAWSDIAFGNGRFVAISSTLQAPAYSFDGVTWYSSPYTIAATSITYGQGVFVAVSAVGSTAYTSPDGYNWTLRSVTADSYTSIAFGYTDLANDGVFLTAAPGRVGSIINAGVRAQARPIVVDGKVTSLSFWEPGSNYTTPTVSVFDPNNSEEVVTDLRIGNGVLGAPTFINNGSGYNTTSTVIKIRGNGYADKYQTGINIICKNLTRLPAAGDNLSFAGNDIVYKVAVATPLYGTTAPNIIASVQISPEMTVDLSPEDNTTFTLRSKYSQVRLTNHDFLNIGYGTQFQSNYPDMPTTTGLAPQDEVIETNNGRVFYTSTDQDGNFKVGDLFAVEQATGVVTLNASQFGLSGLEKLRLGGVAVGATDVYITQFSTDPAFIQNSNYIVPTQKAIKTYLASRLSQGGSNTFTGLLIAGTTKIGGPDEIGSTIPEGNTGWVVKVPVKVNVAGPGAAWAGDGLALSYFMKTWWRR